MVFVQVRLPSGEPARHSRIPAMARESEHQPTRLFARHRAIIARSEVELLVKILICDSREEVQGQFALQKIPVQFSLGSERQTRQPVSAKGHADWMWSLITWPGMDAKRAVPKFSSAAALQYV